MPRFHFNVYDGTSEPDVQGTILSSVQQARETAIDMAGAIIHERAQYLKSGLQWHMDVTCPKGLVLYRLDFTITEPAAAKNSTGGGLTTSFGP